MSDTLQRIFPPEVHESLAELRAIAKAAKSKDDPNLRRCTPDELALAESIRKDWHCTGHNARTGLPCTRAKLAGLEVCRRHGGALKHVQRAAQKRLAGGVPAVLRNMLATATQTENLAAQVKAGQDWLDRANIGALVRAKVRASKKQESSGAQVVVNIGFLG